MKLFASLRLGRFDSAVRACPEGWLVRDLLKEIRVPESEAAIIFVNGRHVDAGTALKEGDTLSIFPLIGGG